jgi:hypothetical protein
MGAYIGADERVGAGDQDPNQSRFEQIIRYSPALESAYRDPEQRRASPVSRTGAPDSVGAENAPPCATHLSW